MRSRGTGLIGAALGLGPAQHRPARDHDPRIGYGLGLILFVPSGDLVEKFSSGSRRRRCGHGGAGRHGARAIRQHVPHRNAGCRASSVFHGANPVAVRGALHHRRATAAACSAASPEGSRRHHVLALLAASIVTYWAGWRAVFWFSAVVMGFVASALWLLGMPRRQPPRPSELCRHPALDASALLREVPILRRRAAYHVAFYAGLHHVLHARLYRRSRATSSDRLSKPSRCSLVAGTGGVIIAPLAEIDLRYRGRTPGFAICAVLAAFVIALIGGEFHSIALLVLAAVPRDAGLVINFGAQPTRHLRPETREPQPHRRLVHRHVRDLGRDRLIACSGNAGRRRLASHLRHRCRLRRCRTGALCW